MFKIIVHNEELPNPISTKFKKIEDFGVNETGHGVSGKPE